MYGRDCYFICGYSISRLPKFQCPNVFANEMQFVKISKQQQLHKPYVARCEFCAIGENILALKICIYGMFIRDYKTEFIIQEKKNSIHYLYSTHKNLLPRVK